MDDERLDYRSDGVLASVTAGNTDDTTDETQHSSLKAAYSGLKKDMDALESVSAFDLKGALGETGLSVEQQILAHQLAQSILEGPLETLRSALAKVDSNFRERANK